MILCNNERKEIRNKFYVIDMNKSQRSKHTAVIETAVVHRPKPVCVHAAHLQLFLEGRLVGLQLVAAAPLLLPLQLVGLVAAPPQVLVEGVDPPLHVALVRQRLCNDPADGITARSTGHLPQDSRWKHAATDCVPYATNPQIFCMQDQGTVAPTVGSVVRWDNPKSLHFHWSLANMHYSAFFWQITAGIFSYFGHH